MTGNILRNEIKPEKKQVVLDMVRKYPLYSVDKLAEGLPEISRHSIQRILEKTNLSTAEKRLQFSTVKRDQSSFQPSKIVQKNRFSKLLGLRLVLIKGVVSLFKKRPSFNHKFAFVFSGSLAIGLIVWGVSAFGFSDSPKISLEKPGLEYSQEGKKLFVIGQVLPTSSKVFVNSQAVSLNGDGTFTSVIEVPLGESLVEVKAKYRGKESQLLRLVEREPSEEELKAQENEESQKRLAAANEAAETERKVNDLLAARRTVAGEDQEESFLRISNNQAKENEGFWSIEGEVVNLGEESVNWVMVTVSFLDKSGSVIDTKYGFATDFEESLKPGERTDFETQPTQKEFDHYRLELSWEKENSADVAGESTGSADLVEDEAATPAAN
ncbi:FxLYD domain-containing protein [Patescibacteria group bacterium]